MKLKFIVMTNRTLIYYVVPEDEDDFEHPNVFAIHKGVKQLTVGDVVDAFPLPGVYHFRFKTEFMKTFVWEDGVDMGSTVPTYKGGVSLKVARLRPTDNSNNPADEYVYVETNGPTGSSNNSTDNSRGNNKSNNNNIKQVNRSNISNSNSQRVDDGPRRRNSTDDLLDMFGTGYDDGNSLAVNTSRSTSSVLSGGDLDDLDFGTSPPTTPMELSNMQPVGQRQKSAPSMINTSTNANFVGSRSSSLNSGKNNSPRSSLVDELIGGNGFKL